MKTIFVILALSLSFQALATAGGCRGFHQGQEILLNAYGEGADPRNATGTVMVDGREVAQFDGRDARINYLFQTAKVSNAQGDLIEGRVTSMIQLTGVVTRLTVQAFGIDFRNIAMTCWMSK